LSIWPDKPNCMCLSVISSGGYAHCLEPCEARKMASAKALKRPRFEFDEEAYRASMQRIRDEEDHNHDTLGVPRKKRGPL
jgi:hypothetical protein